MHFDTEHPLVLTASCESRMGTTAAVTGFLAARRFYIMEMPQFDDTISQRFFVRVTFCGVGGESVDVARLRQEFVSVASQEQMSWRIHDSSERIRVASAGVQFRPLPGGSAVSPPHWRARLIRSASYWN